METYLKKCILETDDEICFIDITEDVKKNVENSGIVDGHVLIQPLHTTVGIYLNEAEERLIKYDVPRELALLYPARGGRYRHDDIEFRSDCPDDEPINGHSHLKSMFCSNPSLSVVLHNGILQMGKYQRIFFAEFDGPCPRRHKGKRRYLLSVLGK